MDAQIEMKDNKVTVKMTLKDDAAEDSGTLDVVVEISKHGVLISPLHSIDKFGDQVYYRETWVEFYLSQFQTYVWNGTQEDPVTKTVMFEKRA